MESVELYHDPAQRNRGLFDVEPLTPKMHDQEDRFHELVFFKKQYNHINVSAKTGENNALGQWINTQKTSYKKGKMTQDRIKKLNEIDFF